MAETGTQTARGSSIGGAVCVQLGRYVALTKPKQTALLMVTAVGAYAMEASPGVHWLTAAGGMAALASAVAGSTALNMVIDRDIDARMSRTSARPLPASALGVRQATAFGLIAGIGGVVVSLVLSPVFGAAVAAGLFFDVVIYTVWLKRRTAYSILVGGVSGGMPAVAGRALATGGVDAVGLLLGLGVVLWIPSHILTLATRYADEYAKAGVPVWPGVFGERSTRRLIAVATVGAVGVLTLAGVLEGIAPVPLGALALAGAGMVVLAARVLARPSERANWVLFKAASAYMLVAFACLTIGATLS